MSDEEIDFGDQNEEEEEGQPSPSLLEEGESVSQASGPQTQLQAPAAPGQDPGPGEEPGPGEDPGGPGDPPDPVPGPSTARSPLSSPSRRKRKSSSPGIGEEGGSKRKCDRKAAKSPSPKKDQGRFERNWIFPVRQRTTEYWAEYNRILGHFCRMLC